MTITDKHVLFFNGTLSNWYKCRINVDSELFKTELGLEPHIDGVLCFYYSEHLFMYIKALVFNDTENAKKIYESKTPREAKSYGRAVSGFDESVWREKRVDAMRFAIERKYEECEDFRDVLHDKMLQGLVFAECNPRDTIWGIGLDEGDPRADNEEDWNGLNLLGKIITETRDKYSKVQN